ncbi:MAG TPA: NADH-quinone oxidoreductase subunit NuoI [Thermodesulfovibrionales bacterium]|jgi:NADH-quinone oxidoreductase subunit I|nr:NADH-quinone oxidoreductase subunit NuoI [Thermodesulfovibrionales bacterium]
MKMKGVVKTVFMTEILKGMALTLKMMFTHPVTRQYPKEKRPAMPGFRGLHALVRDQETGEARCVGCGLCAAICPSQCIHVYTADSPDHKKIVERYEIEVLRCVYCAFCVEACPYAAVVLTEHYEYADYTREAFFMTKEKLLDNWDRYMGPKKNMEYFKKFWHPRTADFGSSEAQAVFRKRER